MLSLMLLVLNSAALAFTDMDGKPDSISNHLGKGKWTILEVWESSCHMCRQHMPEMVKFDGKLKNARIISVSLDGQSGIEAAEDFIDEFEMEFPTIISNPIEMNVWMQQSVGESLVGTPTFILFDSEGKLVAAQPGIVSTSSLEKFITQNSAPELAEASPDEK
jgi:thiol-disulfide isomerase/thioredoxin